MINKKIAIFGIGPQIDNCYEQLICYIGREPDYLIDNSNEKIGKIFRGKIIQTPNILNENKIIKEDLIVFITIRNHEAIYKQLAKLKIKNIYKVGIERSEFAIKKIYSLVEKKDIKIDDKLEPISNKWALITGASRGLGFELALRLAKEKVNLVLHARNITNLENIYNLCSKHNIKIITYAANLEKKNQIKKFINYLVSNEIDIDILINNAAISPPNEFNIEKISIDKYVLTNRVNFIAPLLLCSFIKDEMIKRNYGRIINITTNLSNNLDSMHYISSKASLDKLTIELAKIFKGSNVSVCGVDPGYLKTGMSNFEGLNEPLSAVNGVLLGIILGSNVNGKFINAQEYSKLSIKGSVKKYLNNIL